MGQPLPRTSGRLTSQPVALGSVGSSALVPGHRSDPAALDSSKLGEHAQVAQPGPPELSEATRGLHPLETIFPTGHCPPPSGSTCERSGGGSASWPGAGWGWETQPGLQGQGQSWLTKQGPDPTLGQHPDRGASEQAAGATPLPDLSKHYLPVCQAGAHLCQERGPSPNPQADAGSGLRGACTQLHHFSSPAGSILTFPCFPRDSREARG